MGIEIFKKHIRENRAVKISISKNDLEHVEKVTRSAQRALASAVEIYCDKKMFDVAKKNTKLPIIASSVHPFEILKAIQWGVDGIQIGNFAKTFKEGKIYTPDEYFNIILEVLSLINKYDIYTIVSIPTTFKLNEQLELIKKLEIYGIDLIQIEGIKEETIARNKVYVEDLQGAILNSIELLKETSLPIAISGGIEGNTSRAAFNSGASAVSMGLILGVKNIEGDIRNEISKVVASISNRNSINKEIRRVFR